MTECEIIAIISYINLNRMKQKQIKEALELAKSYNWTEVQVSNFLKISQEEAKKIMDKAAAPKTFTPKAPQYSAINIIGETEKAYKCEATITYIDFEKTKRVTYFCPKSIVKDNQAPQWFLSKKFEELTEGFDGNVDVDFI